MLEENKVERSYHMQTITKDQVIQAINATKSNAQAARYVGVSKQTWKKYAKMYYDENGDNYYTSHNNKYCIGLKRIKIEEEKASVIVDILSGKIPPTNYIPQELKRKIISEGYIAEKCCNCGYEEKRISDFKVPLMLVFRDNNKKNWSLDNIALYCYNCYFINIGDVFTRKQMEYIEGITNPKNIDIAKKLELSNSHMKALDEILNNHNQKSLSLDPDDLIDSY